MLDRKKIIITIESIKGFDNADDLVKAATIHAIDEELSGELNNGFCSVKWNFIDEEIRV